MQSGQYPYKLYGPNNGTKGLSINDVIHLDQQYYHYG